MNLRKWSWAVEDMEQKDLVLRGSSAKWQAGGKASVSHKSSKSSAAEVKVLGQASGNMTHLR